jgi:cystathionine gamma-synthase
MTASSWHPETLAAQMLGNIDKETGALIPPLHPSTTYERETDLSYRHGRLYSRADNPTYDIAANMLTALEGGIRTLLFSSGMAAATSVFLALKPGDHVIVPRVLYWGLRNWLFDFAAGWGLEVESVDTSDTTAIQAALRPGHTKLIWLETPANPLWTIS